MDQKWNIHKFLNFTVYLLIVTAVPIGLSAGDIKLNDDIGTADQLNPASAMSRYGAAVFVWEDCRNGGVILYGQRFTVRGLPAGDGANFRVTPAGFSGTQMNPDVAMDDRGRFVAVWDEKGRGGQDVYGKLFAANGTPIRGEFEIARQSEAGETTGSAAVAMDSSGNFTVCWNRRNGYQSDIYIRRYDATGTELGPASRINAQLTGYSVNPAIGMNRNGKFVVAWEDDLTGVTDIIAQRFDSTGAMVGGNFEVSDLHGQTQPALEPSVAVLDDTEDRSDFFCIVYSCCSASTKDIFANVFHGSDSIMKLYVSNQMLPAEDTAPDVAAYSPYGYIVAWQSGDEPDAYRRFMNVSGTNLSEIERVHKESASAQKQPCVCFGDDNVLFGWQDNRNGNHDVYCTWEGKRSPRNVIAGQGFDGFIPLSWDPTYGDEEPVSYKIYRYSTTPEWITGHPHAALMDAMFNQIATVDVRTRAFPRRMLDWMDKDVDDDSVYFYAVEADVVDSDAMTHGRYCVSPAGGFSTTSSWAAASPAIDGHIAPGEWDGATVLAIRNPGAPQPVTLYLMNDENTLYIAASDPNDAFVDPLNVLGFMIDGDHSGSWDAAPPSDEGAFQLASTASAFMGYFGDYPDGFGTMNSTLSPAGSQGAVSSAGGHVQYEACLDLPAAPGSTIGFAAWVADPGAWYGGRYGNAGEWPTGVLWEAAETLGDLKLATRSGFTGRAATAPASFWIGQNYPNPFNPSTEIRFNVKAPCKVTLKVFDILGREIRVLTDAKYPAGRHAVRFDTSELPSGIYMYRIHMGDFTAAGKMVKAE